MSNPPETNVTKLTINTNTGDFTVQIARVAAAITLALAPVMANATTYRLDATVNGIPEAFGTVGIDPAIVAGGILGLSRSCPQFSPCLQGGPWDRVTFDLIAPLQLVVEQTAPGAIADFSLLFWAGGDMAGGTIKVEGAEGLPGASFLSAALNGGPGCSGTQLCGTYIPTFFADPLPVSIAFVQQVPEPHIGWPLLLAGLIGLPWLTKAGKRDWSA